MEIKHSKAYVKRLAKKVKKETGIKHSEALTVVAKELGFKDWKHLSDNLR